MLADTVIVTGLVIIPLLVVGLRWSSICPVRGWKLPSRCWGQCQRRDGGWIPGVWQERTRGPGFQFPQLIRQPSRPSLPI